MPRPYATPSAYCITCRQAVVILDPLKFKTGDGRPAYRGRCGRCGSALCRILPSKEKVL